MLTPSLRSNPQSCVRRLSIRTLLLRKQLGVAIGDEDQPTLIGATRVQAHFAEYIPLSLILLYSLETRWGQVS